ncbi:hypothetical protein FACS1894208_04730 [Clostridia bacterium]|nr:hypothetical protein FACS1894208_04730 [Clostridia bacterium]
MDAISSVLTGMNALTGSSSAKVLQDAIPETDANGDSFASLLNNALSAVATTDYEDKLTNVGVMTGTLDNLHTATIAAEKAEIMLNLTVQVRNRLVEGYQEVMRMQM